MTLTNQEKDLLRLEQLRDVTQTEYQDHFRALPRDIRSAYRIEEMKHSLDCWEAMRVRFFDPQVILCMCLYRAVQQLELAVSSLIEQQTPLADLDITLVRTSKRAKEHTHG